MWEGDGTRPIVGTRTVFTHPPDPLPCGYRSDLKKKGGAQEAPSLPRTAIIPRSLFPLLAAVLQGTVQGKPEVWFETIRGDESVTPRHFESDNMKAELEGSVAKQLACVASTRFFGCGLARNMSGVEAVVKG